MPAYTRRAMKARRVSRKERKVQWVRRYPVKVRWAFTPPNAQATDGLGRCQSEAGMRSTWIVPANGIATEGEPRLQAKQGLRSAEGTCRTSSPFFERNAVDAGTTPGMEEVESRQEQRPRSATAAESWWELQADRVADASDGWE